MTRSDVRRYLVAYDISSDRRRDRVAKRLQAYGDRVQYSVFIVDASPVRLQRLRFGLQELVDATEDSVLFCDLGLAAGADGTRFSYLGKSRPLTVDNSFVV